MLEAIQRAIQLTHHTWAGGVDEAGRLAAVHSLGQSDMKEYIFDVHLVDCPIPGEGEGEDGLNGGGLGDAVEGLVAVHFRAPSEAPKDPTDLVPIQGVIGLELVAEDPLADDQVGPRGHGTKSHVWLATRDTYSSIARHQWGSTSAVRTKEGTCKGVEAAVIVNISRSTGRRTLVD